MQPNLDAYLASDTGTSFRRQDFDVLCGHAVYCFLKEQRPLYVGSSVNGLLRPASASHHAKDARKLADEVRIWPCKSMQAAKSLEEIMIRHLRPEFNKRAPATERKRVAAQLGNARARVI